MLFIVNIQIFKLLLKDVYSYIFFCFIISIVNKIEVNREMQQNNLIYTSDGFFSCIKIGLHVQIICLSFHLAQVNRCFYEKLSISIIRKILAYIIP